MMIRVWWFIQGFILAWVALIIAGCADQYRYPCQDPANRNSKECKPPVCYADETCTEYLIDTSDETQS